MPLTQTVVDVPDTRLLTIKVPREVPIGKNRIVFFPVNEPTQMAKPSANGKIRLTKKEWDDMMKNSQGLKKLSGILSGLKDAGMGDITKEQIREMRLREKYGEYFE